MVTLHWVLVIGVTAALALNRVLTGPGTPAVSAARYAVITALAWWAVSV